jgi:hypothetical protein
VRSDDKGPLRFTTVHGGAVLTYSDFNRVSGVMEKDQPFQGTHLAVVQNVDGYDLWWVDGRRWYAELERYYRENRPWVKFGESIRVFAPAVLIAPEQDSLQGML